MTRDARFLEMLKGMQARIGERNGHIAQACEALLLSSRLTDEDCRRYAMEANQGTTNLATFRAIARTYPDKQPEENLRDLIASTPGAGGECLPPPRTRG